MQMQKIKTMPQTCHSRQPQLKWSQRTRWASIGATLCAALMLSACASLDGATPEEQVSLRATERWQALIKGEFIRAYSYTTPGYRAMVTADGYRSRFGGAVIWLGAEVIAVNCPEAKKCEARLRLDYKPTLSRQKAASISTHFDETWLFEDGQWWFFQKI
jgi:hypothetical protein